MIRKKLILGCIFASTISASIFILSSCEKEKSEKKAADNQSSNTTEYNEVSTSHLKSGSPCSYPFTAISTVNTTVVDSKIYSLTASQTTDKKWTWRSNTAGGLNFRQFKMTVTNQHSSYPIIVRAVGVKGVFQETYDLLEGCFTVNAGQSVTIRFDKLAPLYNTSFNPVYKCVDWEVVLKNGNEIGKTATTVPVKIALASWTTTEP